MVKLKDKTNITVSEISQLFFADALYVRLLNAQLSFVCPVQRTENMQQGTLARPGLADDGDKLPGLNFEVYPFEHLQVPV